jgi:hypothetical protein
VKRAIAIVTRAGLRTVTTARGRHVSSSVTPLEAAFYAKDDRSSARSVSLADFIALIIDKWPLAAIVSA